MPEEFPFGKDRDFKKNPLSEEEKQKFKQILKEEELKEEPDQEQTSWFEKWFKKILGIKEKDMEQP